MHVSSLLAYTAVKELPELKRQAVIFGIVAGVFLVLIEHVHQGSLAEQKLDQILLLLLD